MREHIHLRTEITKQIYEIDTVDKPSTIDWENYKPENIEKNFTDLKELENIT